MTSQDTCRIEQMHGCTVIYGSVTTRQFAKIVEKLPQDAVLAADIADRIDAAFVIGLPAQICKLQEIDFPVPESRERLAREVAHLGNPGLTEWMRTGERGASAEALCSRIFGYPKAVSKSHPYGGNDFRRCTLFLAAANARDKLPLMGDVSPQWAALVGAWSDIEKAMSDESSGAAPHGHVYDLMRGVLSRKESGR